MGECSSCRRKRFEKYFFGNSMNHYPPPRSCLPEAVRLSDSNYLVAQEPASSLRPQKNQPFYVVFQWVKTQRKCFASSCLQGHISVSTDVSFCLFAGRDLDFCSRGQPLVCCFVLRCDFGCDCNAAHSDDVGPCDNRLVCPLLHDQ